MSAQPRPFRFGLLLETHTDAGARYAVGALVEVLLLFRRECCRSGGPHELKSPASVDALLDLLADHREPRGAEAVDCVHDAVSNVESSRAVV